MNISEKILARASGKDHVNPNDIIEAQVDSAMVNEITGPLAIRAFNRIQRQKVWNATKIVLILDHQIPASSVESAQLHRIMREFSRKQKIKNLYDIGRGGVCHQVMVEKGHVLPGELVVGADSHTCTYGALGAFGTGIGSTEIAAVLATGRIWLKVPHTIRINVEGSFQQFVSAKDLMLKIIGTIRSDGAIYKTIEFMGSTIERMSIGGRMTLCNMAVETGAKAGLINPDAKTISYIKSRTKKPFSPLRSDSDAEYEKHLSINIDKLEPHVACPNSVDNVKPVGSIEGTRIDQAFIGSCTNGRFEDLRIAAEILRGRKINSRTRLLITPASQEIYIKALKNGILEVLAEAGSTICNPTCGACFGGHLGVLADGEVCISSSNRNFVGRMGSFKSQIYLASPATVAASAVEGRIVDPSEERRR